MEAGLERTSLQNQLKKNDIKLSYCEISDEIIIDELVIYFVFGMIGIYNTTTGERNLFNSEEKCVKKLIYLMQ